MKKILAFAVPVLICFALGFFAGLLQADAILTWYPGLVKPALTPPNAVFPVAWSIIYLCIGISAGLVFNTRGAGRGFLLRLFAVQLLFNFLWSVLFFYFRSPLLGFIDIVALDLLVVAYIVRSWPVSRGASLLFAPYLLWILFATYLNGYILACN